MVDILTDFCSSIICLLMVIIIIEMILPDGKNKKYVIFVSGLVVTISMIEPIIDLFNIDLEEVFSDNILKYKSYEVDENLYDKTLKSSYETVLIDDVINRLKENGYTVSNVRVEYDEITFEPVKIYMDLEEDSGFVQPIKIEVGAKSKESDKQSETKIKNIISESYGIYRENIIIN